MVLQHWSVEHGRYVDSSTGLPARPQASKQWLLVRAALFLLAFTVLQAGWELSRGTALEQFVIHDATVRPAVALIRWISPQIDARAVGFSIKAPGGGLNIQNGCEGTEALFLLLAAFLAAPLALRTRLVGLSTGFLLAHAFNLARIVALFYAWRTSPARFDLLHGSVLPIAMVLLVSGYFYVFLSRSARTPASG